MHDPLKVVDCEKPSCKLDTQKYTYYQDVQFERELYTTGWVVTWFLLGYTVRMFEYTVRTF